MIDYYKYKTCFHCNKYLMCKNRLEDNIAVYNVLLWLDEQKRLLEFIRSTNILLAMGCLEYKSIV